MKTTKRNNITLIYILLLLMSFTKKSFLERSDVLLSKDLDIYYKKIDEKCAEIEKNIKNNQYKRIWVFENDRRGPCEHILYYDKSHNLKKVELGAGDLSPTMYFYSYYFDKGLIFIDETKVLHDMEDYENDSKTKTLVDKFYYKNNKLIKWIKYDEKFNINKKEIKEKQESQLKIVDSYIYFNKYKNKRSYSGKGNFSKLLILNGRKLKIKFIYNINDTDSKFIIYTKDRRDDLQEILFDEKQAQKNKFQKFMIDSIYGFKLRVKTLNPNVKWNIYLEFDQI